MRGQAILYLPQELSWIEARKHMPRAKLHSMFCAYWERTDVSFGAFKNLCKRKGWMTGRTGCFAPGQIPPNKGKPMTAELRARCLATAFKPGHLPHNHRGAGHERIDRKDGYVIMIVDEPNPWSGAATRPVLKHRYLWERVNGPVPEGHVLKCRNGDKTNTDPSNWEPVPQAIMPRLNARWRGLKYDDASPELKPAVMTVARVEHAVRQAKAGRK